VWDRIASLWQEGLNKVQDFHFASINEPTDDLHAEDTIEPEIDMDLISKEAVQEPFIPLGRVRIPKANERRRKIIHSPIARLQTASAPVPRIEEISNELNVLTWDQTLGKLHISEPYWMDARGIERRGTTVELNVRALDPRAIPILSAVLSAMEPKTESRVRRSAKYQKIESVPRWWEQELPYVVETGSNTFCWYRASKKLQISGTKVMDENGVLRNGTTVVLHVDQLSATARRLFEGVLRNAGVGGVA